jgi:tetratricopeptide (TPR) repeat protein
MNQRKVILSLFSIISLIVLSQIKAVYFSPSDRLPNASDIDGEMLANMPSSGVAVKSFQARIKRNPHDAVSYTLLAEQYIRQARETGDVTGYQRAEASLEKALKLIPNYSAATTALASAYYAQHDFLPALELAQQVYNKNPKNTDALAVIGDAQFALGNYAEAEAAYQELIDKGTSPALLARLAAVEELKGNDQEALSLMRRAAADALQSSETKASVAWYILRVGDMYFNRGEDKQAGGYYAAALRVLDNYHLALAGLGKVSAAQGRYKEAIAYYQQAINIIPQPDYLASLGDLYILTNQPQQAQLQYQTVEYIGKLAEINQQIYNRQLANFYSDHGVHVEEALQLTLAELKSRKDIYGYDAAAWAHYKNGSYQEAQALMDQAMALGTRDARLYYHAGMIAHALHQDEKAREHLDQALAINPHFSILYADEAQRTLQVLK